MPQKGKTMSNTPFIGFGKNEGKRECAYCGEHCDDNEEKIEYLSSNKYQMYWRFIHLECFLTENKDTITIIEHMIKKIKSDRERK